MKTKIYILFIMFSFSQISICQNNIQDKESREINSLSDFSKDLRHHLITQIDFANKKTSSQKDFYQNGDLNINQVGSYNAVSLNIKAKSINLDVLQNGDKNTFELNKHVNDLVQKVVQDGQNNTIKDISRYHANGTDVNMEFIQKGNNLSIQNYGVNSISKDMKVMQKGNGAAVIIFNLK